MIDLDVCPQSTFKVVVEIGTVYAMFFFSRFHISAMTSHHILIPKQLNKSIASHSQKDIYHHWLMQLATLWMDVILDSEVKL